MEIFAQLTINSIIAGSIYALIALGFNLIFGVSKFFDLGYGSMPVVGAYTTAILLTQTGFGFFTSVILGIIITMFVASLVGIVLSKFKKFKDDLGLIIESEVI